MVCLKDFFCILKIVVFGEFFIPRKLCYQFQKIPGNNIFRRIRFHQKEFFKFAINRFLYFAFKMKRFNLFLEFYVVSFVSFCVCAKFLLNGTHFFTQKILALVFLDFFVQFVLDFFLNAQKFLLLFYVNKNLFHSLTHI